MTKDELQIILKDHALWLLDNNNGKRASLFNANLRSANLYGADLCNTDLRSASLRSADLCNADLCNADLQGANLRNADLQGADLRDADLYGADLRDAYLRNADLRDADLRGAYLHNADLRGADLCNTDLRGAYLHNADLRGAYLHNADLQDIKINENTVGITNLCPEGSFIGWKKCADNTLVKLRIPTRAKRSNATTLKCRCSEAKVLAIFDSEGKNLTHTTSNYDLCFVYEVGKIVKVDDFDENRWNECSAGIHFFIDKEMAKQYN